MCVHILHTEEWHVIIGFGKDAWGFLQSCEVKSYTLVWRLWVIMSKSICSEYKDAPCDNDNGDKIYETFFSLSRNVCKYNLTDLFHHVTMSCQWMQSYAYNNLGEIFSMWRTLIYLFPQFMQVSLFTRLHQKDFRSLITKNCCWIERLICLSCFFRLYFLNAGQVAWLLDSIGWGKFGNLSSDKEV